MTSKLDLGSKTTTTTSAPRTPADTAALPPASPRGEEADRTPPTTDHWRRRYAQRLRLSDFLVLVWAVFGTQMIWFGAGSAQVAIRQDSRLSDISYWMFSAGLVVAWMVALTLIDSRSYRVIGTGSAEYSRIINASFTLFGFIAIFAFLARVDLARGYLLLALPLGVGMLLLERWLWRQWLVAHRSIGRYSAQVLLVGSTESVAQIARELQRSPSAGYVVIGACVPSGETRQTVPGTDIKIVGDISDVERAIAATGADTVAITSIGDLPPMRVKQISWSLEAGRQHLILAPSLIDVAGPRIHTRPVAGLPLIHVETPRFSAGQRVLKRMMDLVVAGLGIIVISPVLLVLAICVKLSSPGPIIFSQTRVGLRGSEFRMLKFRSMVVNAEELLADLQDQRDAGNEVLFKMKNDPRITSVGRLMRRYSLDELPQLFNVLGGSMSLVGPRPPLASEVALYADHVHRRFLVKPGVTGAWQVGGRSSLSWEESVRLDLSYVENWSLVGDVLIILKTARAALAPGSSAH